MAVLANSRGSGRTVGRGGTLAIPMEVLLYSAVLAVGFLLRLSALAIRPLDPNEGAQALGAWQLLQGASPQSWHAPLAQLSAAAGFLLFGDNDFFARIMPVVAGTALLALILSLRDTLGKLGALGAAAVLAFSPGFIFYSRFLSGDIFAAALAVGLIIVIANWVKTERTLSLYLASALLALLLNSGAASIWYLLVFGAFLSFHWRKDYADLVRGIPRQVALYCLALFFGVYVLVGSGLFLNPGGLGFPALTDWLAQFNSPIGLPWHANLLALLAYEPLALVFGALGAVYVLWHKPATFNRFLVMWAIVGLIISALVGRTSSAEDLIVVLPLCLLAGAFLNDLRLEIGARDLRRNAYFLVPAGLILVFTYVATTFLSSSPGLPSYLWGVSGLSFCIVIGLIVTAVLRAGPGDNLAIAAGFGILFLFAVHSGWSLNYRPSAAEWFAPVETSSDGVGILQKIGPALDSKDKKVEVDRRLVPALGWYLRGKVGVYYADSITAGEANVLTVDDKSIEAAMSGYTKQSRVLRTSWFPSQFDPKGVWRWLMFREVYGQPKTENVVLYQR